MEPHTHWVQRRALSHFTSEGRLERKGLEQAHPASWGPRIEIGSPESQFLGSLRAMLLTSRWLSSLMPLMMFSLAGDVKQDPHLLGRDGADRPISEMNKWIIGLGLFPLGLPELGKIGQGSLPSNLINHSDQKDFGAGWEIRE